MMARIYPWQTTSQSHFARPLESFSQPPSVTDTTGMARGTQFASKCYLTVTTAAKEEDHQES